LFFSLSSIKIVAAEMPEYLAHKKTLCVSALCLFSSASAVGGAILAAQSVAVCLQVAPVGECLAGTCATCVCGYIAFGGASELRYHNSGCFKCGKRSASIKLAQEPTQQSMGRVPSKETKSQ